MQFTDSEELVEELKKLEFKMCVNMEVRSKGITKLWMVLSVCDVSFQLTPPNYATLSQLAANLRLVLYYDIVIVNLFSKIVL